MKVIVIAIAALGLIVGSASAMPIAKKVAHNATPITKAGYCNTNCYTIRNQQHCTTQCF